tara:strand:- start:1280 stop:1723 length:444 start_codon:yes stop_codon:yes gene_type:complete
MKKLLLVVAIMLTLNMSAQGGFGNDYIFAPDNFVPIDQQYHFVGGFIFGGAGYFLGLDIHKGDRKKAIWTGIAVGTGANVLKELTDISKTGFNATDVAWGFAGAVASTWITDLIFHDRYKVVQQNRKDRAKRYEKRKTDELKIKEKI